MYIYLYLGLFRDILCIFIDIRGQTGIFYVYLLFGDRLGYSMYIYRYSGIDWDILCIFIDIRGQTGIFYVYLQIYGDRLGYSMYIYRYIGIDWDILCIFRVLYLRQLLLQSYATFVVVCYFCSCMLLLQSYATFVVVCYFCSRMLLLQSYATLIVVCSMARAPKSPGLPSARPQGPFFLQKSDLIIKTTKFNNLSILKALDYLRRARRGLFFLQKSDLIIKKPWTTFGVPAGAFFPSKKATL